MPCLSLLDALGAQGWTGVRHKTDHFDGGPKYFDSRQPVSKRCYFQCLLAAKELFEKGAEPFHSTLSQAYFSVLLRKPGQARKDKTVKELKRILNKSDSPLELSALKGPAPKRPRLADAETRSLAPPYLDDEDVCGDIGVAPPSPACPDPAPLGLPGASSSSSGSSSSSSRSDSEDHGAEAPPPPEHPTQSLGQRVTVEWKSDRGKYGRRVQCFRHDACFRFQTLGLDEEIFGPRSTEFYLGAWLLSGASTEKEHRKFKPSRADVRSFRATYGGDADGAENH